MRAYPHFRAAILLSSKRASAQLGVSCSLGSLISHQKISTSSSMKTVAFKLMKLVTSFFFPQVIKHMQETQTLNINYALISPFSFIRITIANLEVNAKTSSVHIHSSWRY